MATKSSLRIIANADYQSLVWERNAFGWWLTLILCIVYYGFIITIAFHKPLLSTPIGEGMATSWGIPAGFGVILLSIAMTGIYVHRANTKYDAIIDRILAREAGV
ncbi:MAG: DUF485 domain-containing protein [Azoarcus sp.]|jgi:uncharacterized membrane protein (DUF485 family)|nr:DUF485 domain-containing protein [Azoarcus sp.]